MDIAVAGGGGGETHAPWLKMKRERDACFTMADGVQARQDVFSLPAVLFPWYNKKLLSLQNLV
jgi:hypothetical protein